MWTQIYGQKYAKIPFCGPQGNGINIYHKYICTTQPSWVAQCEPALFLFQNLGSTASSSLFCSLRTWKYWTIELHLYMEQITYKQAEAQWLIWGFSKQWGRTKAETCLTFPGLQLLAPQLVSPFVQHHLLNTATENDIDCTGKRGGLPICTTRSSGNSLEGLGLIWLWWTFLTTVCPVYPLICLLPITPKFLTRMKLLNSSNSKFFFWKENISSGIIT